MTRRKASTGRPRFFRARVDPSNPEHDPADDDTDATGIAAALVCIAHRVLTCAACGCDDPIHPSVIESGGKRYAFATCQACYDQWRREDESGAAGLPVRVRSCVTGEMVKTPFRHVTHSGRIARLIDEALDRFIAAGEPLPEGAER